MKQLNFQTLRLKFITLQSREQWLVFAVAVALSYVFVEFGVLSYLNHKEEEIHNELETINSARIILSNEINAETQSIERNKKIYEALHQQVAALKHNVLEIEAENYYYTTGFISAKEAPRFVEHLTRNAARRLTIQSFRNLPRDSITNVTPDGKNELVYKFGYLITSEGRYWDQVDWIKALEKLPWRVEFGKMELKVTRYPKTTLSLELFAFSRDAVWFTNPQ